MTDSSPARPRILILLAAHNGAEFIAEQLNSVLAQEGVDVEVVVSDDASTDSTSVVLDRYTDDPRVRRLTPGRFGSAATNFFRLIRECDSEGFDAVGFCDQDDIWMPGKLRRHYDMLAADQGPDGKGPCSAVSSNVTAFDARGNRRLIVKNQLQRSSDYAFESGGPGSTFLLAPPVYAMTRSRLLDPASSASSTRAHDWLVYALARAHGTRWFIDGQSTVDYRQHDANELGANEGWRPLLQRLRRIADGTHREDVRRIVAAALEVATETEARRLRWIADRVADRGPIARLRLARRVGALRRRRRDQLALAATLLTGIW